MTDADVLTWTRFAAARLRGDDAEPPASSLPMPGLRASSATPYVHAALELVGDPRAAQLKSDLLANELNSVLLDETAQRVAVALRGVEHVFFKGMVTRRRLSRSVPFRIATDVDLLVSEESFGPTESALLRAGFERLPYHRPFLQHFASERVFIDTSKGLNLCVDVHRGLAPWPLAGALADSVLQSRSEVDGLWIPDEEHQLLTLAVHYIKEAVPLDVRDAMDAMLFLESPGLSLARLVDIADETRCLGGLLALMARVAYVAGPTPRSSELEDLIHGRSLRARLVDTTVAVAPPRPGRSTAEMQLRDAWRRSVCLDGPIHAGIALGLLTAKAVADRLWLRLGRSGEA